MRPGSRLNGMLRMSPPIDLADVTICAADSAFVELTARALRLSMEQARFGDAILFSDAPVPGPYRSIEIQPLDSIGAYSRFVLQRLPDFIKTPFALVVQWDGYVVNPAAWANAFRKYDYIGAAWHGKLEPGTRRVGNGGFSLRSRKLLAATKKLPPVAGYNEDALICHAFGDQLEREAGIRFAPVKIADRFSYESHVPDGRPFGFHGFRNLWRHSSDEELATGIGAVEPPAHGPHAGVEIHPRLLGQRSLRVRQVSLSAFSPPSLELRDRERIEEVGRPRQRGRGTPRARAACRRMNRRPSVRRLSDSGTTPFRSRHRARRCRARTPPRSPLARPQAGPHRPRHRVGMR